MNTMLEEIDRNRRRLLTAGAALSLTAVKLKLGCLASIQSKTPGLQTVKPEAYFSGFDAESVETSGTTIHVLRKGTGRPLLLLHGYPETHLTWRKVAPRSLRRIADFSSTWPLTIASEFPARRPERMRQVRGG
jgi:hypothetical protein